MAKEGQLRGCIGTIFLLQRIVAEEIIRNAVGRHSGSQFSPVKR